MVRVRILILFVAALLSRGMGLSPQSTYVAQGADTPESAALKGQGAFLRGAGSYNLNTARANSINVDTVIRWKQDLRKIAAEQRALRERQEAGKKQHLEDVKRRIAMEEYRLRVEPTAVEVQNGKALNALLYDLTDPDISSSDWHAKPVKLPEAMSVKDLIFRFTPASGSTSASKVLSRGVIALSRLAVNGDKWPTFMKNPDLNNERGSYESAYASLRDGLLAEKFELKALQTLDRSLESLQSRVQSKITKDRGFQDEALKFVADLKDATRMFDAATVDYAKEILLDTKDQEATTVAELVSFMLKYRLQFASAERSATGRVLYAQIYEAMRQQTELFAIKPPAPPVAGAQEKDASPFQSKSVWIGDNGRSVLTVIERDGETFRAKWSAAKGGEKVVTGTINGNKVTWLAKDARSNNGDKAIHDHFGTITSGAEGDKIDFVWRGGKGKSGTYTLHRTKNR